MKKIGVWACGWGAVIMLLQVAICLLLAPGPVVDRYSKLNQWDSFHYLDILERGYQIPRTDLSSIAAGDVHQNRANAGFFPAYPFISRLIARSVQETPLKALLLTAQLFCWIFWAEFLYLIRSGGGSRRLALYSAACVACFPSSFFLVAGYSESLFLASLLGFILGLEKWWKFQSLKERRNSSLQTSVQKTSVKSAPQRQGEVQGGLWKFGLAQTGIGLFAVVSGGVLSATRLFGLPFIYYPLYLSWVNRSGRTRWPWLILFVLAPTLGCGLFFLFCQHHFGAWDLYFRLQHLGWGNHAQYWAILNPMSYFPKFFFEDTASSICRASNLFIGMLGLWVARREGLIQYIQGLAEKKGPPPPGLDQAKNLGLYLGALIVFSLCLAGKATSNMDSMVRYNLPVFVLIVLGMVRSARGLVDKISRPWLKIGAGVALVAQLYLIIVFLKGGWVS